MYTNLNLNAPLKNSNRTFLKLLKDILPRDFVSYFTIIAIFFKNVMVSGFILDKAHEIPFLSTAFSQVFGDYEFKRVYFIGFTLIVAWIPFLFKNRARYLASIIVNFAFSFLLLFDVWYMRGFNSMPTLHVLQASGNIKESITSVIALFRWSDFFFVIDIIVLLVLFFVKKNWFKNVKRNIIFSILIFALGLLSVFYIAPEVNSHSKKQIPMNWIYYRYDVSSTAQNISPLGFWMYSTYIYFQDGKELNLNADEKEEIAKWFEKKQENLPDNEYKGMFKGKNLLIIQVESLEKFVLNQTYNGQEITPNLNRLIKNSLFFTSVHEQVGGGNSSDSDLMTNTSIYPIQLGTTFYNNPFNKYNSLPLLLKGQGYYTSAIHPDNGAFWNWMPALKSMGFDKCYDSSNYEITERINMGISDGTYFEQIEPIIAQQKQPFYTFLVTLSSHTPFELVDKYRGLKLEEELDKSKMGGYLQCIHYTDKQIGLLLDKLEADGVLANTVVAIYGDHEGVHKYFPNEVDALKIKQDWWKDNKKQIPLIVYNKDVSYKEVNTTGGQIDTMPTLLYLMGVDEASYANTAMGRNLLKTNKNFAVLRNRTVVGNPSDEDKALALEGQELADKIIRSNYFNK